MIHYHNPNAPKDAKWDAEHNLGNCNQYNPGSASWRMYEKTYAECVKKMQKPVDK